MGDKLGVINPKTFPCSKQQSPTGNGEMEKKGFNLHWNSGGAERGEEQNTGRAGTKEPRNCTKKCK